MAIRKIPPANANDRTRKQSIIHKVVLLQHGGSHNYGPCPLSTPANRQICTGGTTMTALLGPDLGDGQMVGSKTNSTSLQPLMGLLNAHSNKKWIAGHLLNADLGGSGVRDNNLTPLTVAANNAHRVFEGHIKRMLLACNQIDRNDQDSNHWYGVRYAVQVSAPRYAAAPAPGDMHSYAPSHITLDYRFVRLPKFPPGVPAHTAPSPPQTSQPVAAGDTHFATLAAVVRPNFAPSQNINAWQVLDGGLRFGVEIHNEA
ncbi:hypothetical protein [Gallaecimonas pentaromativorans]|uniref:hypothetical protein n=1 Tax=Gallaecimonas pentaromativorans TaxID=584787 RepID=UPI003A9488FB